MVDYKGFRVLASALLPLSKGSLCYGSKDGCNTVMAAPPAHEPALRELSAALNLKPHFARQRKDMSDVLVFSAADVEGHVADDGRFYLLDLSRTMPPVRPLPGSDKNCFLFQHFRPQFVRKYPIPLCSDAFSLFVKKTDAEQEHKREVSAASEYLFTVVIPACAKEITAQLDERARLHLPLEVEQKLAWFLFSFLKSDVKEVSLAEIVHSQGVNLRHLALVAEHMTVFEYRLLMFAEITARIIKHHLRLTMRKVLCLFCFPVLLCINISS